MLENDSELLERFMRLTETGKAFVHLAVVSAIEAVEKGDYENGQPPCRNQIQ